MSEPAMRSPVPVPGDLLAGKYRVLRVIGEGGMGLVLAAEHTLSGKRVAIKWLQPSYAEHPNAGERLVREARAAARVRHPNVVDIYDVIEEGASVMLVMELLEGETLGAALERGDMSIARFLRLVIAAMRGVAAAHKQNVIHRDIKPENIFLVRHPDRDLPVPKVLDFGISKVVDGSAIDLTATGDALGTPLYMSYEQLNGARDLDQRTDVYAFGVLLYEGLSGYPPFAADTFSELIVKVATSDPMPLGTVRPELPPGLTAAVHRAIARDRELRTPSLDVLAGELEAMASENPSGPRAVLALSAMRSRANRAASGVIANKRRSEDPPSVATTIPERPTRRRRWKLWLAGAAVLVLAAIAAAYARWSREAPRAIAPHLEASAGTTPAPAAAPIAVHEAGELQNDPPAKPEPPVAPTLESPSTQNALSVQLPNHPPARRPTKKAAPKQPTAEPGDAPARVKAPRLRAGPLERNEF